MRSIDKPVIQPRPVSDGHGVLRVTTLAARCQPQGGATIKSVDFASVLPPTIIQPRAVAQDFPRMRVGWAPVRRTGGTIIKWSIVGSLVAHLLFGVFSAPYVERWMKVIPAPPPEPEVTMLLFPENVQAEAPPKKEPERYVRTTQNDAADAPPAKPDFISDKNTLASAKNAPDADADAALPSMKGADLPGLELAKRDFKDGEIKNDSAPSPPPGMTAPPSPPSPELGPPKPQVAENGDAPAKKTMPDAAPPPSAPADKPLANTPNPEQASFMPDTLPSNVKGAVERRGDQDAVNAVRTTAGVYTKSVQDAIGLRWRRDIGLQTVQMLPGRITLQFSVGKDGKVHQENVAVLLDEASPMLRQSAVRAILNAKLPAIPEELIPLLDNGRFPVNLNFNFR